MVFLKQKLIYTINTGLFFEQDHLRNLIILGVDQKRATYFKCEKMTKMCTYFTT